VLVAWLLVALKIQATGDCPGAGDVERHLGPLLGDAVAARDVATIARAPDGSLALSLADTSGQPIGARTLPPARTCSDQAKAVAVTLAVWEAQLHPEISLGLIGWRPSRPPARARRRRDRARGARACADAVVARAGAGRGDRG
jgi:hypothetical protein